MYDACVLLDVPIHEPSCCSQTAVPPRPKQTSPRCQADSALTRIPEQDMNISTDNEICAVWSSYRTLEVVASLLCLIFVEGCWHERLLSQARKASRNAASLRCQLAWRRVNAMPQSTCSVICVIILETCTVPSCSVYLKHHECMATRHESMPGLQA